VTLFEPSQCVTENVMLTPKISKIPYFSSSVTCLQLEQRDVYSLVSHAYPSTQQTFDGRKEVGGPATNLKTPLCQPNKDMDTVLLRWLGLDGLGWVY
jgi:hypothetical protein